MPAISIIGGTEREIQECFNRLGIEHKEEKKDVKNKKRV